MDFPLHENELMVWILGSVVLVFLLVYRNELRRLPARALLFTAYLFLWIAWAATNLEHLFWYRLFNVVEHVAYALNAVVLLAWCWFAFTPEKDSRYAHD